MIIDLIVALNKALETNNIDLQIETPEYKPEKKHKYLEIKLLKNETDMIKEEGFLGKDSKIKKIEWKLRAIFELKNKKSFKDIEEFSQSTKSLAFILSEAEDFLKQEREKIRNSTEHITNSLVSLKDFKFVPATETKTINYATIIFDLEWVEENKELL